MLRSEGPRIPLAAAALPCLALPLAASAHSFGRLYNLPVPFWLYGFGAAGALLLSFAVVALSVTRPSDPEQRRARGIGQAAWVRALRRARVLPALQLLSVLTLALCILSGLFGTRDLYRNFNMTFFWVVFTLGFAYLTALAGDFYAAINPWRVLALALGRVWPGFTRGRLRYPPALGSWPALVLYMVFIWIELFGRTRPFSLAICLLVYTALNGIGVWAVGAAAWFRHCEFLAVFFRLLGRMAPLELRLDAPPGAAERLHLRAPLSGLLEARAESLGLLVFILFMLSSTAFDGLRETETWIGLRWGLIGLWSEWTGLPRPRYLTYPAVLAYETLALLLSPFLYLAIYGLFVWLARLATRSRRPLRELALDFAFPLIPIALVYHVTHYFTLLATQGVMIVRLVSDPFGWGWDLLGTVALLRRPIFLDMSLVWHSQVALILLGHIAGVHLSHVVALRVFGDRAQALRSQLPMLWLMVLFTVAGLWILSLPIRGDG